MLPKTKCPRRSRITSKKWVLPGPRTREGKGRMLRGFWTGCHHRYNSAFLRPAQNKPKDHTEEGEGVSDYPGFNTQSSMSCKQNTSPSKTSCSSCHIMPPFEIIHIIDLCIYFYDDCCQKSYN